MYPVVRVLFLNQTYRPDPLATSQYLGRWAEHLVRAGCEVTVLAGRCAYHNGTTRYAAEEICHGVRVIRVAGRCSGRGKLRRAWGFGRFLLAALVRALWLPRPDVIVSLTSPPLLSVVAAIVAWSNRSRWMAWTMDLHPEAAIAAGLLGEKSMTARMARQLSRWSLRRADSVVVLDRHMKKQLVHLGVPRARIKIIPLWIQGDVALDAAGREALRGDRGWSGKFVVMCAGNHGACHPVAPLLAVAQELQALPHIHFCWAGGGSQWRHLRACAGSNVSLIDYVPHQELPALLSAADLHVVVMGEGFTGLLHPCKIYNLLAVRRPFLYLGPRTSSISDLIRAANLGDAASSFTPGQTERIAAEIRQRSESELAAWPVSARVDQWEEPIVLRRLTSIILPHDRFPQVGNEMCARSFLDGGPAGVIPTTLRG